MVYVVVMGTENMGGGYFEVFTSWQRGSVAAWQHGRVAANTTLPYFDRGSEATWPQKQKIF